MPQTVAERALAFSRRHATKGTDLRQLLLQARPNWQGPLQDSSAVRLLLNG